MPPLLKIYSHWNCSLALPRLLHFNCRYDKIGYEKQCHLSLGPKLLRFLVLGLAFTQFLYGQALNLKSWCWTVKSSWPCSFTRYKFQTCNEAICTLHTRRYLSSYCNGCRELNLAFHPQMNIVTVASNPVWVIPFFICTCPRE